MKREPELAERAAPAVEETPKEGGFAIEDLLPAEGAVAASRAPLAPGMRTATVHALRGRHALVALRGRAEPIEAMVAPEVDPAVIADALEAGDAVLVEIVEGDLPLVVARLQTRTPRAIKLKAAKVEIEGDEEVLVRSGQGAVRIRSDGDIEVVGGRISASSRGLFRIVGRMLRLN